MDDDTAAGIEVGDTLDTAMLSPCVGGLVRTWTDGGSRLWGVDDPAALASMMGRGIIARTPREDRRFREVGLLNERTGTLLLQSRWPKAGPDGTLQSDGALGAADRTGYTNAVAWAGLQGVAWAGRASYGRRRRDVVGRARWMGCSARALLPVRADAGPGQMMSIVEAAPLRTVPVFGKDRSDQGQLARP